MRLKKLTAVFFMIFSYALLLGHSFVPHHHHETEHESGDKHHHEHHSKQHNDADNDSKDTDDLYSYFTHSADVFTAVNNHQKTNTLSKKWISIAAQLQRNFSICCNAIPPLLDRPPDKQLVYISPLAFCSGLRAPPVV